MFLDASAIVCMLTGEPEAEDFADRLAQAKRRLTSGISAYEASQAVARKRSCGAKVAVEIVEEFVRESKIEMVSIGLAEFRGAIDAYDRFGKGRHPARLNMGDCFAYACARTHNAPLLFKGEDFGLTDVVAV